MPYFIKTGHYAHFDRRIGFPISFYMKYVIYFDDLFPFLQGAIALCTLVTFNESIYCKSTRNPCFNLTGTGQTDQLMVAHTPL